MTENANSFIDGLLNEIVERVIKKISENNSNWLNNIQCRVKAKNIEGLDDVINDALDDYKSVVREMAEAAAEEAIKSANFSVDVSL